MGLEHFDTVMSFAVIMLLLSMLITVLVQAAVAVSGLRGWNLHFGVIQLIRQLDPALDSHAKEIAKAVLEHPSVANVPLVKWGRRKATAIRPQELIRIVNDLAHNPTATLGAPARTALVAALTTAGAPDPTDLASRVGTAVIELQKMFPAQAQAVQDAVNRGLAKTNQIEAQVSAWFDTFMDRTTDRFSLFSRWITAVIAFVLAIGLQVDAIQIFKQLSVNPGARAALIQIYDSKLKQDGNLASDKRRAVAAQAIRAIKDDVTDAGDQKLLEGVTDELATRKEGSDWLKKTFVEPAKQTEMLAAYEKRFVEATNRNLNELGDSFQKLKSYVDDSGVQVFFVKNPAPRLHLGCIPMPYMGELITGLFLSLGAPFWFNALRQMSNLRPAIAGKVEKEKAAAS